MRLRSLLLAAIAAVTSILLALTVIPAGAHPGSGTAHAITVGDSGRRVIGQDHTGDGDFSQTCAIDDRAPDPVLGPLGVPATGQTVGNCDNDIPPADMTSWEFAYLPPSHANAL